MILKFLDRSKAKLLFKLIYLTNDQHICLQESYLSLCVCLQLYYGDELNKKCSGAWILSQDSAGSWVGSWFWMRWKVHLSDHSIPLISFTCCQLGLLPRQTLEGIFLQNATEDSDLPAAKQWLLLKAFLCDVGVSVPAKLASVSLK